MKVVPQDQKFRIKMYLSYGSLINNTSESSNGYDRFYYVKDTFVLCDGANSCKNGGILAGYLAESFGTKWANIVDMKSNRINLIHKIILAEHNKYLTSKMEAASTLVGLKTISNGFEMISVGDSYGEIFYKNLNSWDKIYSMPRDLDKNGNPWQLVGSEVLEKINYKKFDRTGSYCIFLLSDGAGNFLPSKSYYRVTESIGDNRPRSCDLNFYSLDMVNEAKINKSNDDASVVILYLDF